mmetsp:Transcript_100406/g.216523  ORF Transcript_100406/g.216523 Transcript_100406/m.216523 type:complete len:375 (-) Transcript_100406:27-1151(-)
MAGGKGAEKRKRGDGPSSGKGDEPPPAATGRQAKRKKQEGFPSWMWVVIGLAVLVFAGKVFSSDAPAAKSGKVKGKSGRPDTTRFLELALRLQDMTQIGAGLEQSGQLDSEAATELQKELAQIEEELGDADDSISRDLRSMVSVVRGTIYQRSENLTDEEVAEKTGRYTYANPNYWDDYYNKTTVEERYDWYGGWDTAIKEVSEPSEATEMRQILKRYVAPGSRLMMLGCGNSDMSEKMYKDGFENIMNIDISPQLLDGLRERLSKDMPRMSWKYENASSLTFESGTFDVTLDKGTFDAIEGNKPLLMSAISEAHRTLRPGGYLLSVTFNNPELRVESQLRKYADWKQCATHSFTRSGQIKVTTYYVHACQRKE